MPEQRTPNVVSARTLGNGTTVHKLDTGLHVTEEKRSRFSNGHRFSVWRPGTEGQGSRFLGTGRDLAEAVRVAGRADGHAATTD